MKSVPKLIRRFSAVLLFSLLFLFLINVLLLILVTYQEAGKSGAWSAASRTADGLTRQEEGYVLTQEASDTIEEYQAFALLIDQRSLQAVWHTQNLPEEIPLSYDIQGISWLTRGYLQEYPTTTASHPDGLLVMGYPKDSYWKLADNTFSYQLVAGFPRNFLLFLGINILLVFAIYMAATTRLLRSVRPIVTGVEQLPEEKDVHVTESGLLSEIAQAINRTSEKLQQQGYALRKQETARAGWIAGVSHDIRTPLSMVMGYAGQLEESPEISEEDRKKASVIRQQSMRMKNLINDLNLASKLEYNMQPLNLERLDLVPLARQTAVDFLNLDAEGRYPIQWETPDSLSSCRLCGDLSLLRRAVSNLITNAQVHNPQGCSIYISVQQEDSSGKIVVEDNGCGVSDEQLEGLRNAPHYMFSDSSDGSPRHGLGLMIVRQIAQVHGGTLVLDHSEKGGLQATIQLPLLTDA